MQTPYAALRAQMSPDAQQRAEAQARHLPPALPPAVLPGGWSLWAFPVVDDSPYRYRHVEIWRQEWPEPCCVTPWSLPRQLHVEGLYWRPPAQDDEEHPHA
jgi:hypothetical protein